jgi:hypothetical protein
LASVVPRIVCPFKINERSINAQQRAVFIGKAIYRSIRELWRFGTQAGQKIQLTV